MLVLIKSHKKISPFARQKDLGKDIFFNDFFLIRTSNDPKLSVDLVIQFPIITFKIY